MSNLSDQMDVQNSSQVLVLYNNFFLQEKLFLNITEKKLM